MTKHVEIWTLSKESRVVPYMASSVYFYEYHRPDLYVRDNVFVDTVERRYMDIIQVTKCSAIYDRLEMDSKIERSEKYIAIHPDVEEAISVKWQEKVDNLKGKHSTEMTLLAKRVIKLEGRLDDFKNLPWYKRVWRALWNSI